MPDAEEVNNNYNNLLPRQQHDTIIILYSADCFTRYKLLNNRIGILVIICNIQYMDRRYVMYEGGLDCLM